MTQKHLMIAINWYGPYSDTKAARSAAKDDYDHGLYIGIGKRKYERHQNIQYIGISNKLYGRITDDHPKLRFIIRDMEIWLGEIATAEPSGRRLKATKTTLDYAEWLHARFMGLPLNDKKTKTLPSRSVTVLNRWFKIDYETIISRPHCGWPDLIDYPDFDLPARAVWFGKKQRKFLSPAYALSDD